MKDGGCGSGEGKLSRYFVFSRSESHGRVTITLLVFLKLVCVLFGFEIS